MQSNLLQVNVVNLSSAFTQFHESEQSLQNRTLTGPCSAYDTNFHSCFNLKIEISDAWLQPLSIPHSHVFKFNLAFLRPLQLFQLLVDLLLKIVFLRQG